MAELERFTISIDCRLLKKFDERNDERGYANRSEAIRDLIRNCLVEEKVKKTNEKIAATVTLIYDHHKRELMDKLTEIQHHHGKLVIASTHIHLDNNNCLEVVILRGQNKEVQQLAENMLAEKGVKHGKAVYTSEGKDLW